MSYGKDPSEEPDDLENLGPEDLELIERAPTDQGEEGEWLTPDELAERDNQRAWLAYLKNEPRERVVELGPRHAAIFDPASRTVRVLKLDRPELELPWKDPVGKTDGELATWVRTLLAFA